MNSFLKHLLIFLLSLWHRLSAPLFGARCRFYPPCSEYAIEALKKHGLLKGLMLSTRRVFSCNPLCLGGLDPVPPQKVKCKNLKKSNDN